jgi:hypothetical protein
MTGSDRARFQDAAPPTPEADQGSRRVVRVDMHRPSWTIRWTHLVKLVGLGHDGFDLADYVPCQVNEVRPQVDDGAAAG